MGQLDGPREASLRRRPEGDVRVLFGINVPSHNRGVEVDDESDDEFPPSLVIIDEAYVKVGDVGSASHLSDFKPLVLLFPVI